MIKNPFKKECVISINLNATRNVMNQQEVFVHGYVHFRNNSTLGKQEFQAPNLNELLTKIETFIATQL